MTGTDQQTDSYVNSGTSPPTAVDLQRKRSEYIAEGFKNRTHGEAKFNFRTYIGLGFFGALAASLGLTVALRDAKFIAPHYQKLVNGAADGLAHVFKLGRTSEQRATYKKTVSSLATIFSMFAGTTLVAILPIKWREDRKPEIIKDYDRDYYGADRVENDPTIKEAHALIEAAPKQTWKSVIGSRFIAFGATMGVAALIGSTTSVLGKSRGWSIDKMSIRAGRAMDGFFHRGNKAVVEKIAAAASRNANELLRDGPNADRMTSRILNYLTLDTIYTVMTDAVLFVFTRLLAPMFDNTLPARASSLPEPIRANIGSRAVMPVPANDTAPSAHVSHVAHQDRVDEAQRTAALGA